VLAAAGIASPPSFFAALRQYGWNVAGEAPFRDHHRYASADLDALVRQARAAGAARLVTTEKDLVRLLPFRPFAMPIEAVPLTLDFDDRAGFTAWLLAVVRNSRAHGDGGAEPLGQV
jgi:tetraacyldisaccharide 4'-kinase